jgi:2-iminobutanoate/2-iminopropanoate deaminase
MGIEVINGPGVPKNPRPFSPAIRAGDFVFVSGQASVGQDGQIVPDTFEGEFRRTMSAIEAILAAAGLSLRHVVQVRSYLADGKDSAEYNKLYREYFKEPLPARTTTSGCLGNPAIIKFEMDVVAYVHA